MDKTRLLEFIRLIAAQSDCSIGALEEPADILKTQGEADNAKLVRQARNDYKEVLEVVRDFGF